MPEEKIIFRNTGAIQYNDVAYDKLFELENKTYRFTVTPKTKFWRFGIRFSLDSEVPFFHPTGRYNDDRYPNIEFNAGQWSVSGEWSEPNRLEFGYYYLPNQSNGYPFEKWEEYEPLMPVEIEIKFNPSPGILTASYKVSDKHYHDEAIPLPGFKYFKIFAWADSTDFEIACNIYSDSTTIKTATLQSTVNVTVTPAVADKRILYHPSFKAEGTHRQTEDQLEFSFDIESIASVMALKSVNPPLAIGLFGKWGSGKSFFMDKLSERIEVYASSEKSEYIKNVVQVKFNSWHYSDSNLWASLMTRIFEELRRKASGNLQGLNSIFENLHSTKGIIKEVEKQKVDLQNEIDQIKTEKKALEEEISNDAQNLKNVKTKDIINAVIANKEIQESITEIRRKYSFLDINEFKQVKENVQELGGLTNKVLKTIALIFSFRRGKAWILILFFFLILAGLYWLGGIVEFFSKHLIVLSILVAPVAACISQLAVFAKPVMRTVDEAYKSLVSLKGEYEKLVSKERGARHIEIEKIQSKIDSAVARKDELTIKTEDLIRTQRVLEEEISNIRSGKKLEQFIETRVNDQRYSNNLGIISWIRKDFEELDSLLRQQALTASSNETNSSPIAVTLQIDRIILFIDDLDRCNEEIVVKVLEAIHLLLAFPLFIVIVGVDPRWLNNALNMKLGSRFGFDKSQEDGGLHDEMHTSSFDYLEKIFQIPFAVKVIGKKGGENLIKYTMQNEMEENSGRKNKTDLSENMVKNIADQFALPIVETSIAQTAIVQSSTPEDRVSLKFKREEMEFIQKISPLFARSPRMINSYINIYRIIRAHENLQISDQSKADEYLYILFMLAVVVGFNEFASPFLKYLNSHIPTTTMGNLLQEQLIMPTSTLHQFENFKVQVYSVVGEEILGKPISGFKKNLELISRFSFRPITL